VSRDSKACSTELSEKQLVPKYTVAVLASGSGTNLQAIIEKLHRKAIDETIVVDDDDELVQARIPIMEIAIVITDVKDAPAIKRAWTAGIPTAVIPFDQYDTHEAHDLHMAAAVNDLDIDLVVLAGYMRLLHPSFVKAFPNRIVNVHPALLPAFPGTTAIADALAYGVKVTGVTVHFVEDEMDSGPVIAQEPVRVEEGDTAETLLARIHKVEHELFPRTIRMIAAGKIQPPLPGTRAVRIG
jgi:phosphoribosylglycinamide formyltransferase-1